MSQVVDSPTRGDVILDLMVTNTNKIIGDIKTGGSLGCSDGVGTWVDGVLVLRYQIRRKGRSLFPPEKQTSSSLGR